MTGCIRKWKEISAVMIPWGHSEVFAWSLFPAQPRASQVVL